MKWIQLIIVKSLICSARIWSKLLFFLSLSLCPGTTINRILSCCFHLHLSNHLRANADDRLITADEEKSSMRSIWNCYSFFASRSLQKVCLSIIMISTRTSIHLVNPPIIRIFFAWAERRTDIPKINSCEMTKKSIINGTIVEKNILENVKMERNAKCLWATPSVIYGL